MPAVKVEGKEFEVDGDGFLLNPEIWDEEVAQLFALTDNTAQLNEKH